VSYRVEILPAARRQLERLPRNVLERVDRAILALADVPRPRGCQKLRGAEDTYRIRVGDYRILYEVHDDKLVVLVVHVGDRKDVYRNL
jgi:mRNA interferase RelE/StbE